MEQATMLEPAVHGPPLIPIRVRFGGQSELAEVKPTTPIAELRLNLTARLNLPALGPVAVAGRPVAETAAIGEVQPGTTVEFAHRTGVKS